MRYIVLAGYATAFFVFGQPVATTFVAIADNIANLTGV